MGTCNKTDLVYIGKTINRSPTVRWRQHIAQAANGDTDRFHAAMREHGADAFEFQLIACALRSEDLAQLEIDLINQYDSECGGYNSDGPIRWEKQRSEMSAANSLLFKAMNLIGREEVIKALNDLLRAHGHA